jgi:hypothetical protein
MFMSDTMVVDFVLASGTVISGAVVYNFNEAGEPMDFATGENLTEVDSLSNLEIAIDTNLHIAFATGDVQGIISTEEIVSFSVHVTVGDWPEECGCECGCE